MSNELVIDVVSSLETSIALLNNKQLTELNKEKSEIKFSVGDIYLGKIKKVMPGLNAAFVDIGYDKDAFLHYHDLGPQYRSLNKYMNIALSTKGRILPFHKLRQENNINKDGKINEILKSGQYIVVQIAKEPISTKGPRLTSEISLAGRNLVLLPFSDKVSISSKIESQDEKNRLRMLIQSIKPKNFGVIIRTVAEEKKVAQLDIELRSLIRKWESAFNRLKGAIPPKIIISEMNRTVAFIRDHLNMSYNNIHVNDESIYNELKEYISTIAPEKEKIVKFYDREVPIYEHFGIEKQIKSSFGKTVSFKNGSYLIIEHTEALHAIDVNSGYRSKSAKDQETNAFETNMAAVDTIAVQLKLRDIGGIIVIDFIDMLSSDHRQQVFEKMKKAMSSDKTKHSILPLSKIGVMQITRQRVRPEMSIETMEKCPNCKGSGEITPSILFEEELENHLNSITTDENLRQINLRVHPYIEAYLTKGFRSVKRAWKKRYKCKLEILGISSYHFLEYHFFDKEGKKISIEG